MKYQRVRTTNGTVSRIQRSDLSKYDGSRVLYEGDSPPELPDGDSWAVVEDRPVPADNQRLVRVLTAERDGWDLVDKPNIDITTTPVSKLTIKHRLEAINKWQTFKNLLEQEGAENLKDEWILAQYITLDNPTLLAAKPVIMQALSIDEEVFNSILEPESIGII